MRFIVPLMLDADRKPLGLFSATTSEGPLVIIFCDQAKWHRFSEAVGLILLRANQYLGSVTMEADSLDGLADQLDQIAPGDLDQSTLLPDSAPIVEKVLDYFEGLAHKG